MGVTPLRRRQDGALQMYESTSAYAAQRQGPATWLANEAQWNGSSGQNARSRGRDKGPGKGECNRG